MLEHRHERLLSLKEFSWRLMRYTAVAGGLIGVALGIGVAGYHWIAGLGWIDALLNAAMILTGMGPVDVLHGDAAKLFASGYALFSGVVFLSAAGVFFAPLIHRILHAFHLSETDVDPERRHGRDT